MTRNIIDKIWEKHIVKHEKGFPDKKMMSFPT